MKSEIIITLNDAEGNIGYDLEVPTDVPVGTLIDNIKETLLSYNKQMLQVRLYSDLFSERLGEVLPRDRTLGSIGIWNGDILLIR